MKVSNGSKKRCRIRFNYSGIGKTINSAVSLLEENDTLVIISEFIYDYDDVRLYNILLFLLRENCNDDKILNELAKFDYK